MRRCTQPASTLAVLALTGAPATSNSLMPYDAIVCAKRHLPVAKSAFGYYLWRHGRRHFPLHRRPQNQPRWAMAMHIPYYWTFGITKNPRDMLSQENYVTGDWTGLFHIPKTQMYTLRHATCGMPIRVRRFPTYFSFKSPSRWMIGKPLRNWVIPKTDLIDEAALTKKQRMRLVKEGKLPK